MSKRANKYLWEKELSLAKGLKECCNEKGEEKDTKKSATFLHQLGLVYKERSEHFQWRFTFAMAVLTLIGNVPSRITDLIRNALPAIPTSIRFALIRSAALMNAAIVRKPSNVNEVKNDLDKLHRYALKLAKVQRDHFDVDAYVDEVVREKIKLMREETKLALDKLQHIPDDVSSERAHELEMDKINRVKTLQNNIAEKYTDIMNSISDKCVEVMGKPPCRYCVAGMGSLARKEITPYSDFEHIILLDDELLQNHNESSDQYQSALEYFRWFSILFHVIILRLGETIIPAVSLPSLNNNQIKEHNWFYDAHTPSGISFDGMVLHACKFPLGRQEKTKNKPWTTELIKPVTKMVKYLDADVDLKNGYHLGDILTKTSFVSGFNIIYEEFSRRVTGQMQTSQMSGQNELLKQQLEEDFNNFHVGKNLDALYLNSPFNIKRVVHRSSTLFIAALGRLNSIYQSPCSCYDVIETLKRRRIFDSETAHKLAYAVSIACEVRIKAYCLKGKQDDMTTKRLYYDSTNNIIPDLVAAVGEKSIIDYFKITWSLQTMIREKNYKTVETDLDANIFILSTLGMSKRLCKEWEDRKLKKIHVSSVMRVLAAFYNTNRFKSVISLGKQFLSLQSFNQPAYSPMLFYMNNALISLDRKDDEIFQKLKFFTQHFSPNNVLDGGWEVYEAYGSYLLDILFDHKQALGVFIKLQKLLLSSPQSSDKKKVYFQCLISRTLYSIAKCLHYNGNNKQAIKKLDEIFEVCIQHETTVFYAKPLVERSHLLLGVCYYAEKYFSKAKASFERALLLHKQHACKHSEQKLPKIHMAIKCCKAMLNEDNEFESFFTHVENRNFEADLCHFRNFDDLLASQTATFSQEENSSCPK
ncbi:unnamed protein product [Clavelina lepadiformis]|uniref:Protein-PII uridylyltransferase N-terminal domain-containing protein n=1 Tax=Clavelina lepadiformis TaxID=159417 RepID=A0ABP0FEN0_CLALP